METSPGCSVGYGVNGRGKRTEQPRHGLDLASLSGPVAFTRDSLIRGFCDIGRISERHSIVSHGDDIQRTEQVHRWCSRRGVQKTGAA
jgi:hypothetical protein